MLIALDIRLKKNVGSMVYFFCKYILILFSLQIDYDCHHLNHIFKLICKFELNLNFIKTFLSKTNSSEATKTNTFEYTNERNKDIEGTMSE